jgi:hypothetical protein
MQLRHNYYSLHECLDEDEIFELLDEYVDSGKILYDEVESYIIRIDDLDLDECEVIEMDNLLDKYYVLPYYDRTDDDSDLDYGLSF